MKRVVSIDLFRGLTIALMIFVNDVASVPNAPGWLHHVGAHTDGMTLPDLVFPAFLFIVGMVIPIALKKRLNHGIFPSLKHIGERSLALIIMGVMMLNSGAFNPELSLLPKPLWQLLMYLSFFMIWNVWHEDSKLKRIIPKVGWILLLFLVIIYRRGSIEDTQWLRTGWWGILGLIGWSYGVASLIYLFFRKREDVIILSIGLCILLYIAEVSGRFTAIQPLVDFIHPGRFIGTHSLIVLTGLLAGLGIMEKEHKAVIRFVMIEGLILWFAGWLLHQEYIVSKIQATPVWGLWSAAWCCLIFALVYFLTDIKGWNSWGKFFQPSAQNPLTAYLLPAILYVIFDLFSIPYFKWGLYGTLAGVLRSCLFTGFVLLITHILTKYKVRLKL
jgi:heparan-alpha-glucosaminide N-acetyltransferase